jgi:class 3 adenylate cyclase
LQKKNDRIAHTIKSAVEEREEHLRRAFTESLEGREQTDRFALDAPSGAVADQVVQATVLFSDIRNFTSLAEKLSSSEVAELLTEYFERTCEPVLKNGGRHLKFIGDGLMGVFGDTLSGGSPLPAARRAVSAALGMVLATHEFRASLEQRFARRGLPAFAIGVGLHSGEVTLCRLGTLHTKETTPIGDTVNVAARLEAASKELGWTVVASSAVLQQAGDGIQTGGMTSLGVRGKNGFVDVAEIIGLETNGEHRRTAEADRASRGAGRGNDQFGDHRAVKGACGPAPALGPPIRAGPGAAAAKGNRPLRKTAPADDRVYLASREADHWRWCSRC